MSIRLRLTLLYSAILAITLIAFSAILYLTQSEATFSRIRNDLANQSESFVNAFRRPGGPGPGRPDERQFGGNLPGRWTQTRDAAGAVTGRTGDLGSTTLPLSEAGLKAVQSGGLWYETANVEGEPLLICSRPFSTQGNVSGVVQVAAPIAETEHSLSTLQLFLTGGSGLVILGAFAVGWVLAGAALSPLQRITQTAQAIGAEHDLARRVEHSGPRDEIGQLASTFNTMLGELEQAYRQLEQTLESQRRFVADASHELRTPLTTVRGNIALLGHAPPMEEKERLEVLADTKDEVERLIRLVNQLLGLARADAGLVLKREPAPVAPLLEEVCRQAKLGAPKRTIFCHADPEVVARGDRDALKQVFVILLDNALMHTAATATVQVTAEAQDQHVSIRLRDTGPGIAPQALPHIFERFYRGEVSRSGVGTGLGLSIARELIQAQEGTITVESEVGRGSVFTVTLPRAGG